MSLRKIILLDYFGTSKVLCSVSMFYDLKNGKNKGTLFVPQTFILFISW